MRVSRLLCCLVVFSFVTTLVYGADITGKWKSEANGGPPWVFNFKSEGAKLTGTMQGSDGKDRAINEGKLEENAISFSVDSEWQGQPVTLLFTGKVAGDEIQLRVDTKDGSWGTDVVLKRSGS